MDPITCKNAYYVKLGEKGKWEKSSIEENIIRIGWRKQTLQDINSGEWQTIKIELQNQNKHKATATRDLTALQQICRSTSEDIWITFHKNQLWWCKVCGPEIFSDEISKFRKVEKWHCHDVCGRSLFAAQIPGRLAKFVGFRGTVCKVREVNELVRLINCQSSPEYAAIFNAKESLNEHVMAGLKRLHWKDFETLADLLFSSAGWKRVSILGQAMKYSDIELEDPINKEMYQVQVKSKATLQDFQTYSGKFASDKYRKLFFVVHTPDSKLAEVVPDSASPIQLVLPNRLAEMVIEQGILGWLMDKIR
jgi:hypothetical protein